MGRLILFDTSNFVDFPIGGQLTSIHNFLRYVCETDPEKASRIILVGLTLESRQVGELRPIEICGVTMGYYPVMLGESDLNHTHRSVRMQYVKGLMRYLPRLRAGRGDCCYINTPEAYGPARLLCMGASFVAFSHCNYFDMVASFRFYRDKKWILDGFDRYLRYMVRHLDLVFALSSQAERDYRALGANVMRVRNSIALPDRPDAGPRQESLHRMIYVGRLSLNKGIETIIKAVLGLPGPYTLTIVGEGEEYERLHVYADDRISFTGVVTPREVYDYLAGSDILIMNSGYEGLPMTILEAQSMGLPVVTTDVGGIGEAVNYGEDAEPTDGTEDSIREAIALIEGDYARYSAAAVRNGALFDYRNVNRPVYEALSEYWP